MKEAPRHIEISIDAGTEGERETQIDIKMYRGRERGRRVMQFYQIYTIHNWDKSNRIIKSSTL